MKKIILYIAIILIFGYIVFNCSQLIKNHQDKQVLRFSSWGSKSETDIIHSVIKNYENENPNIKIEFIHIPQNYFQKIHLLFASGLEPDVIFINNQYIKMYINSDLVEELTDYFPDADNVFFKESLENFKSNERLYAIPRDISGLVLYYNNDIFKALNIKPPEQIKDIYELKNLLLKLTTEKNFGINYEEDVLFWLYYLASNGGGAISDDGEKIIINNIKSLEALSLYSDFINKYHIAPDKSQIGSMTTAQLFINGKIAMYLGGRWIVPKFRELIDFDWNVIPFPYGDNQKLYVDSSGWAVSKRSKNKSAAIKLIKYLSSESTINEFSKSGLIIPSRKDSAQSDNFLDNKPPKNAKAFLEMLNHSKPTPVNEKYGDISDILKEKAQIIFNENKSPESVFDDKTVKKLERLL